LTETVIILHHKRPTCYKMLYTDPNLDGSSQGGLDGQGM
jgi:hypothetical protein